MCTRELPRLIGIMGLKRSGKSTIARYLCERYGYAELSVADPLKRGIQAMFGLRDEQVYGDAKEVPDPFWGVTPRSLLQCIGHELMRDQLPAVCPSITSGCGRSVWARTLERRLNVLLGLTTTRYVVQDVRYPDEIAVILERGGVLWHVARDATSSENDSHASEQLAVRVPIRPHARFRNDGSREALYASVDGVLN